MGTVSRSGDRKLLWAPRLSRSGARMRTAAKSGSARPRGGAWKNIPVGGRLGGRGGAAQLRMRRKPGGLASRAEGARERLSESCSLSSFEVGARVFSESLLHRAGTPAKAAFMRRETLSV